MYKLLSVSRGGFHFFNLGMFCFSNFHPKELIMGFVYEKNPLVVTKAPSSQEAMCSNLYFSCPSLRRNILFMKYSFAFHNMEPLLFLSIYVYIHTYRVADETKTQTVDDWKLWPQCPIQGKLGCTCFLLAIYQRPILVN